MTLAQRIEDAKPFWSLEFFPPKDISRLPAFFDRIMPLAAFDPLWLSVTYGAGGGTRRNTLAVAGELQKRFGCEVMAHLTCLGATEESVDEYLDALRERGVTNILALRGDLPEGQGDEDGGVPSGRFRHASDLVDYVRSRRSDFCVAVAGYPDAHPESAGIEEDLDHTARKAADSDAVITQLFFDARRYVDFVARLRERGVTAPIIPGVLPVPSLASIRRILSLCGAPIPGNLFLAFEEAHEKGGDDAVRDLGVETAARLIRELRDAGAPGIHLYTLNSPDICLRVKEAVGEL